MHLSALAVDCRTQIRLLEESLDHGFSLEWGAIYLPERVEI
jgi:hypothetical protein